MAKYRQTSISDAERTRRGTNSTKQQSSANPSPGQLPWWPHTTMKRSLFSLAPLLSSSRLSSGTLHHGLWLRPRLCASARYSTLRAAGTLPLTVLRTPPPSQEQSIFKFVASSIARATHRSGINRGSSGGYRGYNSGPNGPWQRLRDRINAIPNNVIFWGIIGLNGLVFASWNFAWAKYVSLDPLVLFIPDPISSDVRVLPRSKARETRRRTFG